MHSISSTMAGSPFLCTMRSEANLPHSLAEHAIQTRRPWSHFSRGLSYPGYFTNLQAWAKKNPFLSAALASVKWTIEKQSSRCSGSRVKCKLSCPGARDNNLGCDEVFTHFKGSVTNLGTDLGIPCLIAELEEAGHLASCWYKLSCLVWISVPTHKDPPYQKYMLGSMQAS